MAFVVRQARRFLGEDSAAEDVAQDVFLRLYRSAQLFREAQSFRGWLATITSRLALNELRTRRRKRWLPRSTLESDQPGREWRPGANSGIGPEEEFLQKERVLAVHKALAQLPQRQREAVWLQRFEGWDLREVGEALGLTVPAVKSLLHRARASLERQLAPYIQGSGAREHESWPTSLGSLEPFP